MRLSTKKCYASIGGLLVWAGAALAEPVVVVVHPGNPLADFSTEEIRRLYRGTVSSFADGRRVTLGTHSAWSERFGEAMLGMSSGQFRKYWIKQVFSGSAAAPPEPHRSDEGLLEFVASTPGAIAFIAASAVDDRVKPVTIDGRGPGDPGYPLAFEEEERPREPAR